MRTAATAPILALAMVASGCGLLPSQQNACPDTVADPAGGTTDGIDLTLPDWLPAGFPVPEGTSIRHINDGTPSGSRLLTGFIPGGESATVIATMADALDAAGYETLLAADGFVPVANFALVVLAAESGLIAWLSTAAHQAPVRVGDECPPHRGLLVGLQFEPTAAPAARTRFAGASLTAGRAAAGIGSSEFSAAGECLILDGAYTFTATSGAQVGLQFDTATDPPSGWASVDVEGATAFNLALDQGASADFVVTDTGFAAKGWFIDGLGDLGLVEGRVVATCR